MAFFKIFVKILSIFGLFALHIYGKQISKFIPVELNFYESQNIKELRKSAAECTLFLNRNEEFPIKKPGKVLLIGSGARNTIKGGLGSGDVESRYYSTCEQGLEAAGFIVTTKNWLKQYPTLKEQKANEHLNYINNIFMTYKGGGFSMVSFPEYEYDLKLTPTEENADIAIYVLARNSGEGMDRRLIKGDVLLTDTEIKDILYLNKKFKKFMLVLNVGGVVDITPIKYVSNILYLSQLGVVTGDILADIILGKQNPSGKLATTWASIIDYKFLKEFGSLDDTNYVEGIYVGYRYFDSVGVKPLYPFGFGLSYTIFDISKVSVTNQKDEISVKVKVKNRGKYDGKEVVQVYISPSQENADKPYQSLIAFAKTPNIEKSKEVELILKFKLRNAARYDEKKANYVLDKGKYIIRVGNSSDCTKVFAYIELKQDIITEDLKNINSNPDFEDFKPEVIYTDNLKNVQKIILTKNDFYTKKVEYSYECKPQKEIEKLKNKELAQLCIGNYINRKTEGSFAMGTGFAGQTTILLDDIKNTLIMADGPAGLRLSKVYGIDYRGYHKLSPSPLLMNDYSYYEMQDKICLKKDYSELEDKFMDYRQIVHQYATAIPIATAIAQSFNVELAKSFGDIIGKEMEVFNIHLWLAPAMNIHRHILCGRNFEYFSEDPLVSGKIAAGLTLGVQKHKNKGVTLKHFAGNNQEFNRLNNNSKMSERALREIYLKGFQICIEEAHPHALMTSYNLINGIHTSENQQLLINILRSEWGYKGLIMTDWSHSYFSEFPSSKYPPQNAYEIIKGGNNLMMPGGSNDYDLLISKLNENMLTRDDLLCCASKVYETIETLNKK